MCRESMYNNGGCQIIHTSKKLTPTGLVKAFFLPKNDKIVAMCGISNIKRKVNALIINEV